ncbi:MAG: threonyl-tRNA synthetase [Acidobacteriaceae bacterium]|jgi:threonyl-tRNA synthetase|nr:threonyl-tRNA synthetase [Acidobacteriaceae bacterium]
MDRSSLDINLRILYLFFYVHGLNNALTHYHGHQQWRVDWIVRFEHQTTSTEAPPDSAGLLFSGRSVELVPTYGDAIVQDIDHRVLGSKLDLFHQQEEGPGMVFWHPRGWQLYRGIEDYIRAEMAHSGFLEIRTPQVLARSLWERSGHWDKFGASMYSLSHEDDKRPFCLKPMNCPGHIQVFSQRTRSYQDMPLRYSEFGACHRYEPSGSLQGLMRTRAFVQDDAHVFCSIEQVDAEIRNFCDLLKRIYTQFGFHEYRVFFSTRPNLRMGSDFMWDRAEAALSEAAMAAGLSFDLQPGEGAFYGPKLEFHLTDTRGRNWQCGTVQLDLFLPERLNAHFVSNEGRPHTPVLIHHAVLGSIERFIAILLEHYEGWLPSWLAPEQVSVATVTSNNAAYADRVTRLFQSSGLRAVLDSRAERLGKKIVDARERCIPTLAVVGPRDEANQTVVLRSKRGVQETVTVANAVKYLRGECLPPLALRGV